MPAELGEIMLAKRGSTSRALQHVAPSTARRRRPRPRAARKRDAALGAHLARNSGEAMLLLLRCCCWWRWCRHGWPAA